MKETIEEVALRSYPDKGYEDEVYCDIGEYNRELFIEGAKWQQERSYSEEEVLDILRKSHSIEQTSKMDSWITKWFNQFKKK
jgi:hypothetical protein